MRSAETQAFFKEYFDCSTEDPSGSSLIANLPEVKHAVNLTSFEGSMLFKELEANWLFFFSHSRVIVVDHSLPLQVTEKLRPFMLIVEVDGTCHTYKPRSDFLVLKFDLPRVAVEVNSHPPDRPPVGHHRVPLILQGASIV